MSVSKKDLRSHIDKANFVLDKCGCESRVYAVDASMGKVNASTRLHGYSLGGKDYREKIVVLWDWVYSEIANMG